MKKFRISKYGKKFKSQDMPKKEKMSFINGWILNKNAEEIQKKKQNLIKKRRLLVTYLEVSLVNVMIWVGVNNLKVGIINQ